ncbi:hypothetical protein V2J09_019314 [Rumex salicifolius]
MADVVQYRMERMVPELEDHERQGLFSKAEIDAFVRARREYEYRLKRPSPRKSDFLTYIDYEKSVEALRILRKKKKSRDLKEKGNRKLKKSLTNFAGVRRIIELYRMATTRFKGDVGLWFQYLEFCRERKNGRLKKALAQALRFHPKIPGLWIYAASWEFDHNMNTTAARAIMQSGLRECPTSEDLWVEYLRMELTYLNKLMARKAELGDNIGTLVRDGSQAGAKEWKDEHKEEFMALENQGQDEGSEKTPDIFREQGCNILRTVYAGAIEALPASLNLRKRFLEILEATDLAHSEEMQKEILADMKRDFSQDPYYWDWLARVKCNKLDIDDESVRGQVNAALQVYEEAVSVVTSGVMYDLYVKFLMSVIAPKRTVPSEHVKEYLSRLERIFEQAETVGCLTKELASQHISFYFETGNTYDAREMLKKYTNGKFSDDVQLWTMRFSLELKALTDPVGVFGLLSNFLKRALISDAESLWLMALKSFGSNNTYLHCLMEISIATLTRDGGSDDGFSLSSTFVKSVFEMNGIKEARDLYKRYLALPRPGLVLYKFCIELEMNLALSGDKTSLGNARKLFESALTTYKQDVNLWRDYCFLETKMGTSATSQAVNWRAQKILGDTVSLICPTI